MIYLFLFINFFYCMLITFYNFIKKKLISLVQSLRSKRSAVCVRWVGYIKTSSWQCLLRKLRLEAFISVDSYIKFLVYIGADYTTPFLFYLCNTNFWGRCLRKIKAFRQLVERWWEREESAYTKYPQSVNWLEFIILALIFSPLIVYQVCRSIIIIFLFILFRVVPRKWLNKVCKGFNSSNVDGNGDAHKKVVGDDFKILAIKDGILGLPGRVSAIFLQKQYVFIKKIRDNSVLEVLWTVFPIFVLFIISLPSIKLLYYLENPTSWVLDKYTCNVSVVGHQWYWSYSFVADSSNAATSLHEFNSYMLSTSDVTEVCGLRLLEVDNPLLIPINTNINFLVTSADVLHSWAVPSLGIKVDAVPGRLSLVSTNIHSFGVYYGQCSEICGIGHGFMPIKVIGI